MKRSSGLMPRAWAFCMLGALACGGEEAAAPPDMSPGGAQSAESGGAGGAAVEGDAASAGAGDEGSAGSAAAPAHDAGTPDLFTPRPPPDPDASFAWPETLPGGDDICQPGTYTGDFFCSAN